MKLTNWKEVEPIVREHEKVSELIKRGHENGFDINFLNGKCYDHVSFNGAWDKDTGHNDILEVVARIKHVLMWYRKQLETKLAELGVEIDAPSNS